MESNGCGGQEDLGEVERREAMVAIYCVNSKVFNKTWRVYKCKSKKR